MIFIGWTIGCLFVPTIADKRGRKGVFLASIFTQFFVWMLLLITKQIYGFLVLCFLFGICISGRYTVGYVYLVESMPPDFRVKIGLMVDMTEAAIIIWVSLYLKYYSSDWIGLQVIGLIMNALGFLVSLFIIKESPRYLLETGRNEHALLNLKHIARLNGRIKKFN